MYYFSKLLFYKNVSTYYVRFFEFQPTIQQPLVPLKPEIIFCGKNSFIFWVLFPSKHVVVLKNQLPTYMSSIRQSMQFIGTQICTSTSSFQKFAGQKEFYPKTLATFCRSLAFISLQSIFFTFPHSMYYLDIILERKKMAWCCWWLDCELWHGRFYDILNIFCRGTICIVMLMNLHQNGRGKKSSYFL